MDSRIKNYYNKISTKGQGYDILNVEWHQHTHIRYFTLKGLLNENKKRKYKYGVTLNPIYIYRMDEEKPNKDHTIEKLGNFLIQYMTNVYKLELNSNESSINWYYKFLTISTDLLMYTKILKKERSNEDEVDEIVQIKA